MMRPAEVLAQWGEPGPILPVDEGGLINRTWIAGSPPRVVLQRVNPVFKPEINHDIAALTDRLAQAGLLTARLVPHPSGALWLDDEEGHFWRVLTYVPGRTWQKVRGLHDAAEAGEILGRFHRAVYDWGYAFRAPRRNAHDTPTRMAELGQALHQADGHPLEAPAREVGQTILEAWQRWDGNLDLPTHICHGDPKISNVRYDLVGERAICLIDLDTVGPQQFACELGDAWRSWCNPATEDDLAGVRFDVDLFAASARAWLGQGLPLLPEEIDSLVPGIERICLELAARFCVDAVRNSYFRENRARFPQPGAHNLLRARSQLRLARSAREQRSACLAIVGQATGSLN